MAESTRSGQRWDLLDTLRGITLLSMILYHACWDLVWIWNYDWGWYRSQGAFFWQQSICWTFLLLSGFCFSLGRRPVRRGIIIFFWGGVIMAVTALAIPDNPVFFGVLSLLGSAALLTAAACPLLRRIPAPVGLAGSFALFVLTRNLSGGTAVFGLIRLPSWLYRNPFTACLGFPPARFVSSDYFPLLPWLFLYWTGYFLFSLRPWRFPSCRVPVLTAMGRRSLLIYLLHQPVLYALLWVWSTWHR